MYAKFSLAEMPAVPYDAVVTCPLSEINRQKETSALLLFSASFRRNTTTVDEHMASRHLLNPLASLTEPTPSSLDGLSELVERDLRACSSLVADTPCFVVID